MQNFFCIIPFVYHLTECFILTGRKRLSGLHVWCWRLTASLYILMPGLIHLLCLMVKKNPFVLKMPSGSTLEVDIKSCVSASLFTVIILLDMFPLLPFFFFNPRFLVSSTILEEEKLQQKERNRMELRRQVTVSWDSGGSDEAPPKVRRHRATLPCVHVSGYLLVYVCTSATVGNKAESLLCLCCL